MACTTAATLVGPIAVTADIGHQFARAIFAALESPATVDKGELLAAASRFLDRALGGDPNGLELARRMAFRACDWCVLGTHEDHQALIRAARIFAMDCGIKTAFEG
jgi:hypothetical protein